MLSTIEEHFAAVTDERQQSAIPDLAAVHTQIFYN
jgi:hypothetical protein